MEKYYCSNCDEEREAKIECVEEQVTYKGITFTYPRYNLICLTCGKEIYDYDLERKNLLSERMLIVKLPAFSPAMRSRR